MVAADVTTMAFPACWSLGNQMCYVELSHVFYAEHAKKTKKTLHELFSLSLRIMQHRFHCIPLVTGH